MLGVLFVALCEEDVAGGECAEWRAALRVRPVAGASAFPLTNWGGCFRGTLCLSEEGRGGAGDGSLFAVTLDDTRLFLSGLDVAWEEMIHKIKPNVRATKSKIKMSFLLPGCSAACRRLTPPPPSLHGVPCLSVRSVSRLSVCALSGQFVCQAVDGLVVSQDGADMLLKQRRQPQTHTVDLETQ